MTLKYHELDTKCDWEAMGYVKKMRPLLFLLMLTIVVMVTWPQPGTIMVVPLAFLSSLRMKLKKGRKKKGKKKGYDQPHEKVEK